MDITKHRMFRSRPTSLIPPFLVASPKDFFNNLSYASLFVLRPSPPFLAAGSFASKRGALRHSPACLQGKKCTPTFLSLQKILILLALLITTNFTTAQTTSQNYVQSLTARDTIKTNLSDLRSNHQQVQTDVVYVDGLGRTVQEVMQKASPDDMDIIKRYTYDAFGRQDKDYLPFEADSTSGAYQSNVGTAQQGFYTNPPAGVASNDYPYSQTLFENSPLNRPLETSAPGTPWRSSVHGGSHTVDYEYRFNMASDQIRLITVDQSSGQLMTATTNYAANELRGTLIGDEDDKKMLEFTDKAGKVVCKINAVGTADQTYTYYVYDNRDLLTFVIPPQAVAAIGTNWHLLNDATFRNQWLFRYKYDGRNRMIEKQVPGAAKVEMVYDKRDRLVFTLDGNRRTIATTGPNVEHVQSGTKIVTVYEGKDYVRAPGAKILFKKSDFQASKQDDFSAMKSTSTFPSAWLYTKYDNLNRPVMTGIIMMVATRASLQQTIDTNANYDFSVSYVGGADGNVFGYDNSSYPSASGTEVLTVTYYDNYDFITDFSWGADYTHSGHHPHTIGLVTGSLTKLLASSPTRLLKSVTYYDDRLRPAAQMTENYFSKVDEVVTTYKNEVSPLVASTSTLHRNDTLAISVMESFIYDHRDRLRTHTHQIDNNPAKTLVSNTYNAIGQLIEKDLDHPTTPVQSIDYRYNERGWLTTINGGATNFDDPTTDQFGMELKYNNAPTPHYNGNIGQLLWKTKGGTDVTTATQDYQYTYDHLNRLKSADYTGLGNHDVDITYDKNGNILSLNRMQRVKLIAANGTYSYADHMIDQLSYAYASGNQLSSVADHSTSTGLIDLSAAGSDKQIKDLGFEDGACSTKEYSYDANGNMISDANKGITNIQYNYLNLPQQVTLSNGKVINYTYDAAGIKHAKVVEMGTSTPDESVYSGPFHYQMKDDGTGAEKLGLAFLQHAEGRARHDDSSWFYEYNLTDHLGNVRVTVDESGTVKQRQDYYPFGLTFNSSADSPENLYKYNGKEEQKETQWVDYGARMYDLELGRWMVVDPMSEELYHLTPYNYAENSPLRFIDPDGQLSTDVIDNGDGTYDVVGGDVNDGDKGIYVVAQNDDGSYSRTGERIGESVTTHSFYNADNQDPEGQQGWQGTIDTNSTESGDLIEGFKSDAENESIVSYMPNATDGEKYDFKRNGNPDNNDRDNHHRGSLWGVKEDGTKVYGSARDAGNYAAGYISGLKGLGWEAAKLGFNTLEFVKSGSLEGAQSTLAQKLGHADGKSVRQSRTTSLRGFGPGIPIIKK